MSLMFIKYTMSDATVKTRCKGNEATDSLLKERNINEADIKHQHEERRTKMSTTATSVNLCSKSSLNSFGTLIN
jgi:hypothetical protein